MTKKKMKNYKALEINTTVSRVLSDFVRTTLGPKYNNKMLINEIGIVNITNNGATILNELKVKHPTAKLIIQSSKYLKEYIGDGTTSSIIILNSLLEKSYLLIKKGFSINNIIQSIKIIMNETINIMDQNILNLNDLTIDNLLRYVASTIINGKISEDNKNHIINICIKTIDIISNNFKNIDYSNENIIQFVETNKNIKNTDVINGITFSLERDNFIGKYIFSLLNLNVLLIDEYIEPKTKTSSKIRLNSINEKEIYIKERNKQIIEIIDNISSKNIDIIFSTKKIPDLYLEYFEKKNIIVFKPIEEKIIKQISMVTKGKIIRNWKDFNIEDIGKIQKIEFYNKEKNIINLYGHPQSRIATIIIRGETLQIANNIIDSIDCVTKISRLILSKDKNIICGGGSLEMEIALKLRDYSKKINDSKQKIIALLSEAFEEIPKQLAINSGYNPIDKIIELRKEHSIIGHNYYGLNINDGTIIDLSKEKIYEPYILKRYIFQIALETALMILRIDDILKGSKKNDIYNKKSYQPKNYTKI